MKFRLLLVFGLLSTVIYSQDLNQKFDAFLKQHVSDGLVRYADIKKNPNELNLLVDMISKSSFSDNNDNHKAFLINAYNILVLKSIVDNYPVDGPQSINGIYNGIQHNIAGKKMTLDDLENKILRKQYKDARIHFALVCGALGCPPITDFAYTGVNLIAQLDDQAKKALNNNEFIRVDSKTKTVFLSEIFKWFKEDFTRNYDSEIAYINSYRNEDIPKDYKVMYYPYDWTLNDYALFNLSEKDSEIPEVTPSAPKLSNVQAYTPSKLLKRGQFEVQAFSNIYTQTAYHNELGEKVETNNRVNYYATQFTVNYGITKSRWLNVGMDANLRSFSMDTSTSSPFQVLRFANDSTQSRTTISSIGPKLKISPFKRISISLQSTLWIPIAKDLEGDEYDLATGRRFRPWLDWDRYVWWNQFFYDQPIGKNKKFQIFMEADLLFRFAKDSSRYFQNQPKSSNLMTPVSFFLSYFPTKLTTIYGFVQHSPTWETKKLPFNNAEQTHVLVTSHFSQAGLGFKYQVTDNLALELLYTDFFAGKHWGGAGETFNLGIRFLK
ncbi:MAG: DUF547 domain-containing protein [Flavobacteriales bacterium]|nr:DUF547 domain-containing protein [Flavobacteriales bacterium]